MDRKIVRHHLLSRFSVKRMLNFLLYLYAFLFLYAFFFSERQMFPAPRSSYLDTPEILKLTSGQGVQISALYLPNRNAIYTILYSHGNAEHLGEIRPRLEDLRDFGFSVFAYDYQGYGTSQGTPSEQNAYQDIDAAYRHLTQNLAIPANRIIVYGRSIGGGPSTDLAAREPVAGLILESTFVTIFRVVTKLRILPFDKFNNLAKIRTVRCPVLIMHGTDDQLIPLWHGQRLFKAANEPKRFYVVERAGHQDLLWVAGDRYRQTLWEFNQWLQGAEP